MFWHAPASQPNWNAASASGPTFLFPGGIFFGDIFRKLCVFCKKAARCSLMSHAGQAFFNRSWVCRCHQPEKQFPDTGRGPPVQVWGNSGRMTADNPGLSHPLSFLKFAPLLPSDLCHIIRIGQFGQLIRRDLFFLDLDQFQQEIRHFLFIKR